MPANFVIGLDLGQVRDYTALAVIERPATRDGAFAVRHLQRFALGTPYPEIVKLVLMLREHLGAMLVVDQTGVGRAVVDQFIDGLGDVAGRFQPVTITAGRTVQVDERGHLRVPKVELVAVVRSLLGNSRLRIARSLSHAETLARELARFQVKITKGRREIFGAWRQGAHDDLVLALALAAWWCEKSLAVSKP